ncbi:Piwi-like protein 2 [Halotydeus destructor]|nr:Piwi-like protein 2 [Halotydeus destructor]
MAEAPGRGRAMRGRGIRPQGGGDLPVPGLAVEPETSTPATRGRGRGQLRTAKKSESSSPTPPESVNSGSGTPTPPSASPTQEVLAGVENLRISQKGPPSLSALARVDKEVGKEGRPVKIAVNYVRVKADPGRAIYEYHVRFSPDIDSRRLRTKILRSEEVSSVIGNILQFTGINLFLPKRLDEDPAIIKTKSPTDDSEITVTFEFIKIAPYDELIPFFNTLFRRVMGILKMVQINRHFYLPQGKIDVEQHKLEIWPGWVTAIQEHDAGLLLACDASHRILRKATARDLMIDLRRAGPDNFVNNVKKIVVGCVVLTRYNNKPYRVDDIAFDQNPMSTFTKSDGTEITYVDYFKTMWSIEIKDMKQPLLIHRPKPKRGQEEESPLICLIPELSFMTGLTDEIRSDFRAMRDIATHTRIPPAIRNSKLREFLNTVQTNDASRKTFTDWGMVLETNPLAIEARHMAPEKLMFGNRKVVDVNEKADWGRDATNSMLISAIPITKWIFIYNKRDAPKAKEFFEMLASTAKNMGFSFAPPNRQEVADDMASSYVNKIRENYNSEVQLVVVMTPGASQREDRYNAIKKVCCCDIGVPSQVLRCNTVSDQRKARSVCQKIALQITCKVGGELWAVQMPLKTAMIIGIDVYHDPTQRGRSVVAFVASINAAVTRWYSKVIFQEPNQEMVHTLQTAIVACLSKYLELSSTLPDRIFVYRDGVGDGQLPVVQGYETMQLETAIAEYSAKQNLPRPKLTTIVVQKRISTKMFRIVGNGFENPAHGTVLDHTVTRPFWKDFFLVSQHVNQGTVTPTHYVILNDASAMPVDRIQRLTYKLTHLYYNWPGTVRVPAPTQYAHKLAYLAGQNIKKTPHENLSDLLFFL